MNYKQIEVQTENILWVLPSNVDKARFLMFVEQARLLAKVAAKIETLGSSVTISALGDDLLKRIKEATC